MLNLRQVHYSEGYFFVYQDPIDAYRRPFDNCPVVGDNSTHSCKLCQVNIYDFLLMNVLVLENMLYFLFCEFCFIF
jgi:hypothetical protein